jgi:hypothetical protein
MQYFPLPLLQPDRCLGWSVRSCCRSLTPAVNHPRLFLFIVHLHPVAYRYYTFTFFFRLCAACQCLRHFIVFLTLVTFENLQNHTCFGLNRPSSGVNSCFFKKIAVFFQSCSFVPLFFVCACFSFILPSSNLQQWHNFHQCARSLVCLCVSLDQHSVPFGHIYRRLHRLKTFWPHSHTNLQFRSDSLLMIAKIWPLRGPQTWSKIQSHRPFCSLVKLRHVDWGQRH